MEGGVYRRRAGERKVGERFLPMEKKGFLLSFKRGQIRIHFRVDYHT